MTPQTDAELFSRTGSVIRYIMPSQGWIRYDLRAVMPDLVAAKAAIVSLKATPFYREWVEKLQEVQLKMEVAGTSRIEGADFTEKELEDAIVVDSLSEASAFRRPRLPMDCQSSP